MNNFDIEKHLTSRAIQNPSSDLANRITLAARKKPQHQDMRWQLPVAVYAIAAVFLIAAALQFPNLETSFESESEIAAISNEQLFAEVFTYDDETFF